jgi:hypothetical protein
LRQSTGFKSGNNNQAKTLNHVFANPEKFEVYPVGDELGI